MQKYKDKHEKPSYRKQISNDEDLPIVVKKQVKDNYVHEASKKHFIEPVKVKGHIEDERKMNGGLMRQQSERYRQATDRVDHSKFAHPQSYESYDKYERENLTDRQKYREILESKKYQKHQIEPPRLEMHRLNDYRSDKTRDLSPENVRTLQRKTKVSERFEPQETHGHDRNKHKIPEEFIERNPYRQPDSLPYRESIESMMKSPVMKYKSRTAYDRSPPHEMYPIDPHAPRQPSGRKYSNNQERDLYIKDSSPMSTMKKTSPKDRFQDAKEKFQAMEKIRLQQEVKPSLGVRRSEPSRYEKDYRQSYSPEPRYHVQNDWSSEEEFAPNVREYREVQGQQRQHHHQHPSQQRFMAPAKSLGNLAKGYRHSYAEPMKYCNRVGLAAIEPY